MSGKTTGKYAAIYANDPFLVTGIAFGAAMSLASAKPGLFIEDGKDRGMSPRGYGQYLKSHRGKRKKGEK